MSFSLRVFSSFVIRCAYCFRLSFKLISSVQSCITVTVAVVWMRHCLLSTTLVAGHVSLRVASWGSSSKAWSFYTAHLTPWPLQMLAHSTVAGPFPAPLRSLSSSSMRHSLGRDLSLGGVWNTWHMSCCPVNRVSRCSHGCNMGFRTKFKVIPG